MATGMLRLDGNREGKNVGISEFLEKRRGVGFRKRKTSFSRQAIKKIKNIKKTRDDTTRANLKVATFWQLFFTRRSA